jgi:hypothetical protein
MVAVCTRAALLLLRDCCPCSTHARGKGGEERNGFGEGLAVVLTVVYTAGVRLYGSAISGERC